MSASPLVTRTLTAEEIPAFIGLVFRAFLDDPSPEPVAAEIELLEPHRTHGAFDGDELIGGATMLSKHMTLPGTGPHPGRRDLLRRRRARPPSSGRHVPN